MTNTEHRILNAIQSLQVPYDDWDIIRVSGLVKEGTGRSITTMISVRVPYAGHVKSLSNVPPDLERAMRFWWYIEEKEVL